MQLLPATESAPSFTSLSKTGEITEHFIAGWEVDGDKVNPVLFPVMPKNNELFYAFGMTSFISAKTGVNHHNAQDAVKHLTEGK